MSSENRNLYEDIVGRREKISLVGLGYVGMPIAVSFSKKAEVIGFDINQSKIELYQQGIDPTREVGNEAIKACSVDFTSDESRLREARFHIVAVPTPVNPDHTPDLSPVLGASAILGRNLVPGSIVVYESTVYPGTGVGPQMRPRFQDRLFTGADKSGGQGAPAGDDCQGGLGHG